MNLGRERCYRTANRWPPYRYCPALNASPDSQSEPGRNCWRSKAMALSTSSGICTLPVVRLSTLRGLFDDRFRFLALGVVFDDCFRFLLTGSGIVTDSEPPFSARSRYCSHSLVVLSVTYLSP